MAVRKKAVAKKKQAIATMASWESKLATMAREESAKEVSTDSNTITWPQNGGTFEYKGSELGEEMSVVVVDSTYINSYYDRPYDPDNPSPPACFAVGDFQADMVPHENAPVPQAKACTACEWNEFGTDARGKGKACKNTRRLAVLDPAAEEELAYINIPPTSLKSYSGFVKKVEAKYKRPAFAVVADISFDSNVDYAKLKFDYAESIDDAEVMQKIVDAREENAAALRTGPDVSGYTEPTARKRGRAKR